MAAKLSPSDPEVWNALGLALVERRRYRDAQLDFVYAARLAPRDPGPRLNLAVNAHQHLRDPKAAAKAYQDYLDLAPDAPNAPAIRALLAEFKPAAPPPAPVATNALPAEKLVAPPSEARRPETNVAAARRPVQKPSPPPAASNIPPPVDIVRIVPAPSSNAVVRSDPVRPAPDRKPVVVSQPPKTEIAAPKPPPPAEAAPVDDAPVFKVAHDVVPPPARSSPAETAAAQPPPAPATNFTKPPDPSVGGQTFAAIPSRVPADPGPPPKRTFWNKVNPVGWGNPVRWFKGDKGSDAPAPERVATPGQPLASLPLPPAATGVPPAAAFQEPAPELEPRRPDPPRYAPTLRSLPQAGDRARAEATVAEALTAADSGAVEPAVGLYQRAASEDPALFSARYNLALLALKKRDPNLALGAAEAAASIDPGSIDAHRVFAAALQRGGFPIDAVSEFEKVLQLAPDDAAAHYAAAAVYARDLGDDARARAHYRRALELNPALPNAAAVRQWLAAHP
jgi:tetratricopeptide (TPR) repeat protein